MNLEKPFDQLDLPKRFGLSERASKFLNAILIILGSFLLLVSVFFLLVSEFISALIILFIVGSILWVVRKYLNYVEATREGLRQGKTFIPWDEVSQVEETKTPGGRQIHIRTGEGKTISLGGTFLSIVPPHELDFFLTLIAKQAKLAEKKIDIKSYVPKGILGGTQELIRAWTKPQAEVKLPEPDRVDFPPFNWTHKTQQAYVYGTIILSCSIVGLLVILGNDWAEIHKTLVFIFIFTGSASLFSAIWLITAKTYGVKKGLILAILVFVVYVLFVSLWLRIK